MNDLRSATYNLIKSNPAIMDKLVENMETWGVKPKKSIIGSLVPVARVHNKLQCPFLTFDFGVENRVDEAEPVEFYRRMVYIRAYVSKGFGYVEADRILREVYNTLHEADVALENDVCVEFLHDSTGPDSYDEGLDKDYIESTYKVHVLK